MWENFSKQEMNDKETELLGQGFIKNDCNVKYGRTYSSLTKIAEFIKGEVKISFFKSFSDFYYSYTE